MTQAYTHDNTIRDTRAKLDMCALVFMAATSTSRPLTQDMGLRYYAVPGEKEKTRRV